MADFADFEIEVPRPKVPTRGSGAGDPPPGSGMLSPTEQAASDAFEAGPKNSAVLTAEIARLTRSNKPEDKAKLAILMDPTQNGMGALGKGAKVQTQGIDFGDFERDRPDPLTKEALAEDNKATLARELFGKSSDYTAKNVAKEFGRNVVSATDMVLGIPGQVIGVGADLGMRARAIGAGSTRREGAQAGVAAHETVNEALGAPLTKFLKAIGVDVNGDTPTAIDAGMSKLTEMIKAGGAATERATNGVILKEDVESLANEAMTAGGARGVDAGLKKLMPPAVLEGTKLSPGMVEKFQQQRAYSEARAAAQKARNGQPNDGSTFYTDASGNTYTSAELVPDRTLKARKGKAPATEAVPLSKDAIPEMPVEPEGTTLIPPTVERALRKFTSDQAWDMTAEERIAMQGFNKETPPTLVNEAGTPLGRGSRWDIDKDGKLMAVGAGAAAATAALLANEEDRKDILSASAGAFLLRKKGEPGFTLEQFKELSPTLALGSLLERSDYTLKTLDRLDQKRTEFSKAHIEQELKRQDVTEAEKNAMTAALNATPGEKITAKDLMVGVKEALGDFELTARKTDQYADYGLESIGRSEWVEDSVANQMDGPEGWDSVGPGQPTPIVPPTTTLYRLPDNMRLTDQNHFSDNQLFGWTRSFVEGGVRHVVEIQSDLAQHMKGLMPEERAAKIEARDSVIRQENMIADAKLNMAWTDDTAEVFAAKVTKLVDALEKENPDVKMNLGIRLETIEGAPKHVEPDAYFDKKVQELRDIGDVNGYSRAMHMYEAFSNYRQQLGLLSREHNAALNTDRSAAKVAPIIKNWPKRLVREELADVKTTREKEIAEHEQAIAERAAEIERLKAGGKDENGWGAEEYAESGRQTTAQYIYGREMALKELQDRLASLKGLDDSRIRFATADTVAKVEGWPLRDEVRLAEDSYQRAASQHSAEQARLQRLQDTFDEGYIERHDGHHKFTPDELAVQAEQIEAKELAVARAKERADAAFKTLELVRENKPKPSLSPEHQSIFDRYKRDIEKFLRQLGGTDYTDSAGHTWIEVPLPKRGPKQMFGRADPDLVRAMAAASVGATVGAYFSGNDSISTIVGGLAGLGLKVFGGQLVSSVDYGAGAASTRVKNISPGLAKRLRDFEHFNMKVAARRIKQVEPFLLAIKKVPEATRKALDLALTSNNKTEILAQVAKVPGLGKLWDEVQKALKETEEALVKHRLLDAADVRPDYFPRVVNDREGLAKALNVKARQGLEKRIFEAEGKAAKAGAPMEPLQTARVINQFLRGIGSNDFTPSFLKDRQVGTVTEALRPFYASPAEALHTYLASATRSIEKAKLFGKDLVRDPETGFTQTDASIGELVRQEMAKGKMSNVDARELEKILTSRFGPGEHMSNPLLQGVKNLTNAGLLGNIASAASQIGDSYTSIYAHGIRPTLEAVVRVLANKRRVTAKDFGLVNHISEEFANTPKSANFLNAAFKWSGFTAIDLFGKAVNLEASLTNATRRAKSPSGVKALERKYGEAYGSDFPQLIADLKAGRHSDHVSSLLFSELSDLQPISKMEMPQMYLDLPNGRTAYMLHTFMLKQVDIVRRDVYNEMRQGNVPRALYNLARYGLVLGIAGASTDMIKDWMLGKAVHFNGVDIALNMVKTFGWSEWIREDWRKGNVAKVVGSYVVPPYRMWEDLYKAAGGGDLTSKARQIARDKAIQYLGTPGKLYYYHFLGGAKRAEAGEAAAKKRSEKKP